MTAPLSAKADVSPATLQALYASFLPAGPDCPAVAALSLPSGLRCTESGTAVLKVATPSRKLADLVYVEPSGTVRFHSGARPAGGYISLGRLTPKVIVTVELTDAARVHADTGCCAVAAFETENVATVISLLAGRYPESQIEAYKTAEVVELKTRRKRKPREDGNGSDIPPPPERTPDGRPVILIAGGQLPEMADAANELLADPTVGIFRRGTALVRPVKAGPVAKTLSLHAGKSQLTRPEGSVVIAPVESAALCDTLTRLAGFARFDARSGDWAWRDCPTNLGETLIARRGHGWRMPPLKGIVRAPTLRPDGSVLDAPGYDAASHMLFVSDQQWPPVEVAPGLAEAESALDLLAEPIRDLPFVGPIDRSAALALILTSLVRPVLPTAPCFCISAPAAGSGKSLMGDIAALLATGKEAAVVSGVRSDEELSKHLGAALMAGDQIVALDNLTMPLRGDFLCSLFTQSVVNVRVLGESRTVDLPTSATIVANGNGLVIQGDMARRTLLINLDAKMERPELRQFDWDPREFCRSNRTRLVTAALTVLRAFIVSGKRPQLSPFGSFESWSELIRGALVWLGQPDPHGNADAISEGDPERERTSLLFAALAEEGLFTVKDLVRRAPSNTELSDVLREFNDPRTGLDPQRIGSFLRRHAGRNIGGRTLRKVDVVKDIARWRVS